MREILIVGLGLAQSDMTFGAAQLLAETGRRIVLRTDKCGAADWLRQREIPFVSMDALYDEMDDFDGVNAAICEKIRAMAQTEDVLYGVIDVRDVTAALLVDSAQSARVIPGVPVDGALTARACGAYQALAASDWEAYQPEAWQGALVREIDTPQLAGEIKLRLMERYPEEQPSFLLNGGEVTRIALCDLDRQPSYDHKTCLYVPAEKELTRLERYGFDELRRVMRVLRGPDGCPWDKAQTHESLKNDLVEEAYEVIGAIDEGDTNALFDELGDVLLQVALHAEIARQHGEFTCDDVTSAICAKMISRHRHIFGDARADTPEEVLALWEKEKRKERGQKTARESMLSVSKSLPSLMRAKKVLKKAELPDDTHASLEGLRRAADAYENEPCDEKLGALLLCAADMTRVAHADGELLLNAACDAFIRRFEAAEK